jgi:protein phosphatase
MGTTLTMAFHLDAQLCVVHVGDSRAYLYGDGELYQLTHDDTLVAEMVSRGEIQPEQVAGHRFRHVITNVVGGHETGVHVEAHALDVRAGERLLLCSNGLTQMVTDDVIAAVLETELDPEAAATKLVALANEAGGSDNVTVLIVRFDAVAPELAKS